MGKIRTKTLGLEEVEKEQAAKARARREGKKAREGKESKSESTLNTTPAEPADQTDKTDKKETKTVKKTKKTVAAMNARGKKYQKVSKKVEAKKTYDIPSAVKLLKEMSYAQFDQTVEIHLNLKEDGIKGEVSLPHGTGKQVRVVVVDDDVIADIAEGKINFDILIAHPSYMVKLAKHAKVLGPRGLMPNPKTGTVTEKTEEAVKKFSGGVMRYKAEAKFPLLHQAIGKMSFDDAKLIENVEAFVRAVAAKNINSAYLSATMTPSVRIVVG